MSSRSLRSGRNKRYNFIGRSTRQNRSESAFHQTVQATNQNKRFINDVCSPKDVKRKRREIVLDRKESASCVNECEVEENSNGDEENLFENENKSVKRKPRMASLNAIAKVNAVFENYIRCDSKKDDSHDGLESRKNVFTELTSVEATDKSSSEEKNNLEEVTSNLEILKSGEEKTSPYRAVFDLSKRSDHAKIEKEQVTIGENEKFVCNDKIEINLETSIGEGIGNRLDFCESTMIGGKYSEEESLEQKSFSTKKQYPGTTITADSDCLPCNPDTVINGFEHCKPEEQVTRKKFMERAIQTEVNHKCIQTDLSHLPKLANPMLCTCSTRSNGLSIPHYNPTTRQDCLSKPIYVKSSVLAYTNSHTLVVPVKKHHAVNGKENSYYQSVITKNIMVLLDACINNTLIQNNFTSSKLVYIAQYNFQNSIINSSSIAGIKKKSKDSIHNDLHLQVPSLNFAPISVPDSNHHREDKKNSKESEAFSKQKIKSPIGRRNKSKCNGWQFEGDPLIETYNLGNQEIIRHYYHSLRRKDEYLRNHDAVILKSGLEKLDSDYLARISTFWEDLSGPHAGDMMMSIYWYYKPEQTNFKLPETSKMEVYASRHRDDNSVACIVDKCYVLSFTQFCRFQAQKVRLKEKRKKKLKVVPENINARSCYLPSPDVDELSVFFSRYGYDHRTGKLLKPI